MKWNVIAMNNQQNIVAISCQTQDEYCVFYSDDLQVKFRDEISGVFETIGINEIEMPEGKKHAVQVTMVKVGKVEAMVAALGSGAAPRLQRFHS